MIFGGGSVSSKYKKCELAHELGIRILKLLFRSKENIAS